MKLIVSLFLFLAVSVSAIAQGPHAEWRTIETEHFRFHFPSAFEQWTRHAAGRMESIRERLIVEIGYEPPQKIDVLVMDPLSQANGSAWPFLGNARMVLWTNPPGPESVIGNYTDWIELVSVHEEAHLIHLLRPSRNPLRQLTSRLLPIGPIGLASPRWVSEGYATVMEGDFTGSGRPNSALRASILRQWARSGSLPSYGQMAADSNTFLGMSMAYLMGSAYLEWLREREGPDSLRNLWARLTARRVRSFDEAFTGVFGDSPQKLYARFTAELTHAALEIEEAQDGFIQEGELWQDLRWNTGEPDVSADGKHLVTVIRNRDEPERLVVVTTEENTKAEEKWNEDVRKLLERDPQDVAAVRRRPLPREPLYELMARDATEHFITPRWIGDTDEILFWRFEPDFEGTLHPDLFRWSPRESRLDRLTYAAGLRDADPSPDGTWAVAVRNRFGMSQLVRVDLGSGAVEEITPATVSPLYDSPRISPDGRRIAYVRHEGGAWRLIVREVDSGAEKVLHPSEGSGGNTSVAQPEWLADGTAVYATIFRNGFVDIGRFPVDGGPLEQLTTMRGAALAPAAAPEGLYFLSLERDGLDIRYLAKSSSPNGTFTPPQDAWPLAGSPDARPVTPFDVAELGPSRPYGAGRQEVSLLFGGGYAASNDMFELGLRVGDVVGRTSLLLLGAAGGDRGFEGGALAGAWRGFPLELNGHLFTSEEHFTEGSEAFEQLGLEIGTQWDRRWAKRRFELSAGALAQEVEAFGVDEEQGSVFIAPEYAGWVGLGKWRVLYGAGAWLQTGRTGDQDWQRLIGSASFGLDIDDTEFVFSWDRGSVDGDALAVDRFSIGGLRPSILPRSAFANRVSEPALESGTLSGTEFESQSADVALFGSEVKAFFQRHRAFEDGASAGDWLDLAGLRLSVASEALPLLQIPGADIEIGVAQILSGPMDGETNWWFSMMWRP